MVADDGTENKDYDIFRIFLKFLMCFNKIY